jgi:hypothetical protein
VTIDEANITEIDFLIKFNNKLDIGDTSLQIYKDWQLNEKTKKQAKSKELVISYKTIYINTYNVVVMDISQKDQACGLEHQTDGQQHMIFRHESFQLWESECTGLHLQNENKDFVQLSKDGIQVLSLGSNPKRAVMDRKGIERMIHSLESVNFLKQDRNNFVLFECNDPDKRKISIQQEYQSRDNEGEKVRN